MSCDRVFEALWPCTKRSGRAQSHEHYIQPIDESAIMHELTNKPMDGFLAAITRANLTKTLLVKDIFVRGIFIR